MVAAASGEMLLIYSVKQNTLLLETEGGPERDLTEPCKGKE